MRIGILRQALLVFTTSLWAGVIYLFLWNEGNFVVTTRSRNDAIGSNFPPVESTTVTERRMITESFVISFDPEDVEGFMERNNHSGITEEAVWVAGVDGFDQKNLDIWAKLSGQFPPLNASHFDRNNLHDKGDHRSPHAVGCYLAHWFILSALNKRPPELRPDVYMIFEDDSSLVPDLAKRTLEAVRQLPADWDMFFIGGKPFTYFSKHQAHVNTSADTLRRDICRGVFGKGESPLAPDGSRELLVDQPFWRITYITNTNGYVVNPQRIDRVMNVLKLPRGETKPIDIVLAGAMQRGDLKVYMPTQTWCVAHRSRS